MCPVVSAGGSSGKDEMFFFFSSPGGSVHLCVLKGLYSLWAQELTVSLGCWISGVWGERKDGGSPESFAQKQCQQVASGLGPGPHGGHPDARLCSRGRGQWCPCPVPSPLSPPPLRKQSRWNHWMLSGRPATEVTWGFPGPQEAKGGPEKQWRRRPNQ